MVESIKDGQRPRPALGLAIAAAIVGYGVAAVRRDRRTVQAVVAGHLPDRRGRSAATPSEIPGGGWWDIAVRVWGRIGRDNLSLVAAGVAFYGLLAIFPAFAALVSVYGLVADPATVQHQISALGGLLPDEALKLLSDGLQALVQKNNSKLGFGLLVGLALTLWSARA